MRERKRKNFNETSHRSFFLGKASMTLVFVGLIFALGLLYLSQSNAVALKGYSLSDLEKKRADLEVERDRLQIEATRLQSIQEIQKSVGAGTSGQKFVPVQKINYLPSSNVAIK